MSTVDQVNNIVTRKLGKLIKEKMEEALKETLALFDIQKITRDIEKFDGDKTDIYRFIESVEQTLKHCAKLKDSEYYKLIIQSIRQKVIGEASQSLINHNVKISSWTEIKKQLTSKFADTRDETNLQFELYGLIKLNLEPEILYEKIVNIISLLTNQIKLTSESKEVIEYQTKQYQKTGLIIFTAGLKEPFGTWLRAKNPQSLTEALDFVNKEKNIKKLKPPTTNFTPNKNYNTQNKNYYNPKLQNNYKPQVMHNAYNHTNFPTRNTNFPTRNTNYNNNYRFPQSSNYNHNTNQKFQTKKENKNEHKPTINKNFNIETNIDDENFTIPALDEEPN